MACRIETELAALRESIRQMPDCDQVGWIVAASLWSATAMMITLLSFLF